MAKRYIGDAVITLHYEPNHPQRAKGRHRWYRGSVRVGRKLWTFASFGASHESDTYRAPDSPRSFDRLAGEVVHMGVDGWAPDNIRSALNAATRGARNPYGEYMVYRTPGRDAASDAAEDYAHEPRRRARPNPTRKRRAPKRTRRTR